MVSTFLLLTKYIVVIFDLLLQYEFSGRFDLVGFIKEIKSQGLYVTLRIGPYIESECTYG